MLHFGYSLVLGNKTFAKVFLLILNLTETAKVNPVNNQMISFHHLYVKTIKS